MKCFESPQREHIMPASGGKYFIHAYNAQAAVDRAKPTRSFLPDSEIFL